MPESCGVALEHASVLANPVEPLPPGVNGAEVPVGKPTAAGTTQRPAIPIQVTDLRYIKTFKNSSVDVPLPTPQRDWLLS